MRLPAAVIAALGLSGCQTTAPPSSGTSDAAHALYTRLTDAVKTCWFAGDAAFADYVYSPEINAGAPRILLTPKSAPHGRPVLVIEPKGVASADVYGPLLSAPAGQRVRGDLGRWLQGSAGCT